MLDAAEQLQKSPSDHIQQQDHAQQLTAYQHKWDEELESFKKLAARLQAVAGSPIQQQPAAGTAPSSSTGQQTCSSSSSSTTSASQLSAAIQQAEAMLAGVHASAVQSLSTPAAADNKLLAKQLRLQRNQAFEAAKALLVKAAQCSPVEAVALGGR